MRCTLHQFLFDVPTPFLTTYLAKVSDAKRQFIEYKPSPKVFWQEKCDGAMEHKKKSICNAPSGHVRNGFLAMFGGPHVPSENNLKCCKNGRKPKLLIAFWEKEDYSLAVRIKSAQAAWNSSISLSPSQGQRAYKRRNTDWDCFSYGRMTWQWTYSNSVRLLNDRTSPPRPLWRYIASESTTVIFCHETSLKYVMCECMCRSMRVFLRNTPSLWDWRIIWCNRGTLLVPTTPRSPELQFSSFWTIWSS